MPDIGTIRPQLTEMTEPIRALIVLPLLYAMLTQLRTGPDPNAYGFWEALVSGLTAVTVFLALRWLVERYHPDDREEAMPRETPPWG